jgi:hypothetical protein
MAQGITEAEAQAISADAYIYFYSLVTMDVTRRQFTNIEAGKELGKGPMNLFNNVPTYPPADFKGVVRPNFDTLYSIAYLDTTKEPVVVSVPDTNGRYYLLPMLDMWSDVFASPGWRTTGTQAGNSLVTPRGWRPDLGERAIDEFKLPKETQRIEAPTPYVWIIGRTKGHRRRFSDGDKQWILQEAAQPGASAAEVARRYGIAQRVLRRWKQELATAPAFVTIQVTDADAAATSTAGEAAS